LTALAGLALSSRRDQLTKHDIRSSKLPLCRAQRCQHEYQLFSSFYAHAGDDSRAWSSNGDNVSPHMLRPRKLGRNLKRKAPQVNWKTCEKVFDPRCSQSHNSDNFPNLDEFRGFHADETNLLAQSSNDKEERKAFLWQISMCTWTVTCFASQIPEYGVRMLRRSPTRTKLIRTISSCPYLLEPTPLSSSLFGPHLFVLCYHVKSHTN